MFDVINTSVVDYPLLLTVCVYRSGHLLLPKLPLRNCVGGSGNQGRYECLCFPITKIL